MSTSQPTSAAERLAALIELAHEHDDELSYIEVEQLQLATRRRVALRETRRSPAHAERRTPRQA